MIQLYFISLSIFVTYICIILIKFGIPRSISESSYLWGKKGYLIFYGVFIAFILPLLIYWLDITSGQTYQFMVFLSCAALCFTGISGRFRGDYGSMELVIHNVATFICAILAQIWMWIYIPGFWKWSLIGILIATIIGFHVGGAYRVIYKTDERYVWGDVLRGKYSPYTAVIFFIEMALFISTYVGIAIFVNNLPV